MRPLLYNGGLAAKETLPYRGSPTAGVPITWGMSQSRESPLRAHGQSPDQLSAHVAGLSSPVPSRPLPSSGRPTRTPGPPPPPSPPPPPPPTSSAQRGLPAEEGQRPPRSAPSPPPEPVAMRRGRHRAAAAGECGAGGMRVPQEPRWSGGMRGQRGGRTPSQPRARLGAPSAGETLEQGGDPCTPSSGSSASRWAVQGKTGCGLRIPGFYPFMDTLDHAADSQRECAQAPARGLFWGSPECCPHQSGGRGCAEGTEGRTRPPTPATSVPRVLARACEHRGGGSQP